jgi:hypothetical protein
VGVSHIFNIADLAKTSPLNIKSPVFKASETDPSFNHQPKIGELSLTAELVPYKSHDTRPVKPVKDKKRKVASPVRKKEPIVERHANVSQEIPEKFADVTKFFQQTEPSFVADSFDFGKEHLREVPPEPFKTHNDFSNFDPFDSPQFKQVSIETQRPIKTVAHAPGSTYN